MGRTHLYKDMQTRDLGETPIMETATSTHTHTCIVELILQQPEGC